MAKPYNPYWDVAKILILILGAMALVVIVGMCLDRSGVP